MGLWSEIFTWWNGNTVGTRFYTWRKGEFVGEDEFGNKYYRERKRDRRWVIYNDVAEPSTVPAGWHSWLHYTTDTIPDEENFEPKPWHKGHVPNMTGTAHAYRPSGSTLKPGERPPATGDYDAWRPD